MISARVRPLWMPTSMMATLIGPTGTAHTNPVSAPAPTATA